MKLKVIIVDDEKENIELLSYFIEKFCKDVEIVGVARDVSSALVLIEKENPHMIFLDIELSNGETGFDLVEVMKGWNIQTVFVTAYSQYAYEAIKNGVVDYILKPISIVDLQKSIDTVKERINLISSRNQNLNTTVESNFINESDIVAIPHQNEIELVKKADIIYMKAEGKYTLFCVQGGAPILSSRNIREYEVSLTSVGSFIRVHHSYLININHLVKVEKLLGWACIMSSGDKIPVSRRKKDELYQKLNL